MTANTWAAGNRATATLLNGMESGQLMVRSSATTVANTVTESWLCYTTIPANDAQVGMVYRIKAFGTWSVTGTPTLNIRMRLGSSATPASNTSWAQLGATTTQSGVTTRLWMAEQLAFVESTGALASWSGPLKVKSAGFLAGSPPYVNDGAEITTAIDGSASNTIDSTVANYFGLTATWGTASASNTITCKGFVAERLI